ncbi:MAG TPA: 6-carboxytetrahydropterin synthase [Membranihabitans sp.]|nr:6-carboxytetrahydropterin synthase [Membranihabitans sp.]
MRIAIIRKGHFNAAHRLHVRSWSEEKNLEVFGKCANSHYHGHNYEFEVKVIGEVDPLTGMLINLKDLKEIIREHIEDYFDHRNLNVEIPEFEHMPPTTENLCYVIHQRLTKALDDKYEIHIRLSETPRNFAEYPV